MPRRKAARRWPLSDTGGDPGPATGDPGPSQGGRDELRGQRPGPVRRRRFGWRTLVATILIVIGCLLAPVSVLAVWAANEVGNTGRYVATMEPLVHNPAIQNALTGKITTEITNRLNVTGYADQAAAELSSRGLPKASALLKSVAPSIASGVTGYIHSEVRKIVTGPRFARAWVQANTLVHEELVKALSGQGGSSVSVKNGQVVVGLGPFIDVVKQDLVKRGFTLVSKIPAVNPTLTLFSAKYLVKAQAGYRLINDLKIVLPVLTVLLLALGVFAARGRRRALIGAGLGLAASMLVPAAGLFIFRGIYLGSVPASVLPADAAAALFDTLVGFIKEGLRTVLAVGLVVAAGTVPDRAVGNCGPDPGGFVARTGKDPSRRRAGRRAHRPGGDVDLRPPEGAAHLGRGPGRAGLRVLGPAHRRRRHRARHLATGDPRADRADRQQAACPAGSGRHPVTPAACGLRFPLRFRSPVIAHAAGLAVGSHPRGPR